MKVFALPENVAVALVRYLELRPYNESYELIDAIQALKVVVVNPPVEEAKTKEELKEPVKE